MRGWWSDPLYLGTKPIILVNPATDLKPALEVGLGHPWGSLLVEDDGDGEAGDRSARLVGKCEVHGEDVYVTVLCVVCSLC